MKRMNNSMHKNMIPVTVYIYKTDPAVSSGIQHELGQKLLRTAVLNEGISEYELRRSKKGKPLVFAADSFSNTDLPGETGRMQPHPADSAREICYASISHTDGLVVCAICATRPVGVDAEAPDGHKLSLTQMRRTEKKLLKQEFEPGAETALAAAAKPLLRERTERFCERWTLAEAFGKMKGVGLAFSEGYNEIVACPHETKCTENSVITVLVSGEKTESLSVSWKEVSEL